MKRKIVFAIAALIAAISGGAVMYNALEGKILSHQLTETQLVVSGQPASEAVYRRISPEDARRIMSSEDAYILLDVRTTSEFSDGHIAGAVLIPDFEIAVRAEAELPDKNALIIVYCQSGRRSANAANTLINMGYTNVVDLGGIIDWPYEIVTDDNGSLDGNFKPFEELNAGDIVLPSISGDVQEFTVRVSDEGFSPRVLVAQIGTNIAINFYVDDSKVIPDGEEYLVFFPEHRGVVNLAEKTRTPNFVADRDFSIENATGSMRTFVGAVEDINNFDADKIISAAKQYVTQASS